MRILNILNLRLRKVHKSFSIQEKQLDLDNNTNTGNL